MEPLLAASHTKMSTRRTRVTYENRRERNQLSQRESVTDPCVIRLGVRLHGGRPARGLAAVDPVGLAVPDAVHRLRRRGALVERVLHRRRGHVLRWGGAAGAADRRQQPRHVEESRVARLASRQKR